MKNNLKQIREARGLTQSEAARGIGVTPQAWQLYEYGKRTIKSTILLRMKEFFGVSIDMILADDREKAIRANDEQRLLYLYWLLNPEDQQKANELVEKFTKLNDEGKQKAMDTADDLAGHPKYKFNSERGPKYTYRL